MKKSELRNIIREIIKENLGQEYPLDELTFATVRQFFPEGEVAFPNAVWYDQVKIKDKEFNKDKEMSIQAKAAFLDRERKAGRTTGFD